MCGSYVSGGAFEVGVPVGVDGGSEPRNAVLVSREIVGLWTAAVLVSSFTGFEWKDGAFSCGAVSLETDGSFVVSSRSVASRPLDDIDDSGCDLLKSLNPKEISEETCDRNRGDGGCGSCLHATPPKSMRDTKSPTKALSSATSLAI